MSRQHKKILEFVSNIIRDEEVAFQQKLFHSRREADNEACERGLLQSGLRIDKVRNIFFTEISSFIEISIDRIESLQREQEIVITKKQWDAIEGMLLQTCDSHFKTFCVNDEELCKALQTNLGIPYFPLNNLIVRKINVASSKNIQPYAKKYEFLFKKINLIIPWVALVISILALFKK